MIPTGWARATIGDVCAVTAGQSPPGSSYNEVGDGMPFFQGKAEFGDLRPTVRKWTTEGRKFAEQDDILLSVRAPVGPTNLAPVECVIGRGLVAIRPLSGVRPRFVLHALRASADDLAARATGSTFSAVSGDQVRAHPLLLPPLAEQQRIVVAIEEQFSRLDAAATTLLAARNRNEALRKAVLEASVDGWPVRPLGDFAAVFVGTTPSRSRPELWSGDIAWVSSGEVRFKRISSTRETIASVGVSADRIHPPGTVLLAMIGEGRTRGQAAILDIPAAHNQNSAAIRVDVALCSPEWLFQVLLARYDVTRRAGSGGQQPALNRSKVQSIEVPLPPLEEQRRIVEEIEQQVSMIDSLRAALESAQKRSATLRHAILKRAFRGELVPQDPDDESASVLLERIRAERATAPEATRKKRVTA